MVTEETLGIELFLIDLYRLWRCTDITWQTDDGKFPPSNWLGRSTIPQHQRCILNHLHLVPHRRVIVPLHVTLCYGKMYESSFFVYQYRWCPFNTSQSSILYELFFIVPLTLMSEPYRIKVVNLRLIDVFTSLKHRGNDMYFRFLSLLYRSVCY